VVERARGTSGYALLGVLWISAGVTALAATVAHSTREGIAVVRNRIALTEAQWSAEGCVALAQSLIAERLQDGARTHGLRHQHTWNRADAITAGTFTSAGGHCDLEMHPVGSRADINTIEESDLVHVMRALGMSYQLADSIAKGIIAARPFFDHREITSLLGDDPYGVVENALTVEPGPVSLNHGSAPVLEMLPGFSKELVDVVIADRARGVLVQSFAELGAGLSPSARDTLAARSAQLPATAVLDTDGWVITARRTMKQPAVTAVVEIRIGRSGSGITVVRHRSWIS